MDSLTPSPIDKTEALHRRYGANLPATGPWNDVIASLLEHRSVRAYRPDPLPDGTLETLVAAAASAATSSNMQWWSAIAVTDPAVKKELAAIAGNQKHIEQCPLYLAWVADMARNQRISETEKVTFEAMPWLETFMVACLDVALAAQNAVVAAESLGLGTVYIGAMRNDPVRVARLLGLPAQAFVVFGLCVGYADSAAKAEVKPRLPQSAVLHHGRYGAAAETADRGAYDAELAAFSARNEMQATTWTQRVLNRLGPIKSMNGREKMRAALATLGFEVR
ncbi:MAG: NADPH-dependent oxidoreductase [Alphaproteobacteria bacterium]|nr:NADPH-dependent oxidoreductase [Alphaproteobacteria bacterium]MBV8409371.1 NADPH-dependent oxidoreductase [Alphaproteobacteria bacterium]